MCFLIRSGGARRALVRGTREKGSRLEGSGNTRARVKEPIGLRRRGGHGERQWDGTREARDRRAHHHESSRHHFVFLPVFCIYEAAVCTRYLLFTSLAFICSVGEMCIPFMGKDPRNRQGRGVIAELHRAKTGRSLIFAWCFLV